MLLNFRKLPFSTMQGLTLILLFLSGMNVANKYYYLCLVAVCLFIISRKKIILDWNFLLLLAFSFSWIIFSPDKFDLSVTFLIKPLLYPLAYLVGRNFYEMYSLSYKRRCIVPAWTILSAGPFVHYIINFLNNVDSDQRNTVDVWTGLRFSATGQAAMACMMMGVAISFLFISCSKTLKLISILVLIITIMYNFVLSGRTLIIMMALIAIACVLYLLKNATSKKKSLKIIAIFLSCILFISIILSFNLFGLRDYFESSNLYYRFMNSTSDEFFSSGRFEMKLVYFENFSVSLLGGSAIKMLCGNYAHDLFLDTYDEAGFFALFAILFFILRSVKVFLISLKNDFLDINERILILGLYISCYLEFMIEPILQGVPWLFMLFCVVHGMLESIYCDCSYKKKAAL